MKPQRRGALLAASLIMALLGACVGPPQDVPPAPKPDVGHPDNIGVTFLVETFDADDLPIARLVQLTVVVVQHDGGMASYIDPTRGPMPGPMVFDRKTPWTHTATLTPGLTGVFLTALHLGQRGETIRCRVEVDGQVPSGAGARHTATIAGFPGSGAGSAAVTCFHTV